MPKKKPQDPQRQAIVLLEQGAYAKLGKFKKHSGGDTPHESLLKLRGGIQAMVGKIGTGAEEHIPGPDAIKFIKKFDPSNTSGAVKDALDIMEKFKEKVKAGNLTEALQPIQNILGGKLYSAMAKSVSAASAGSKMQDNVEPVENIIQKLIHAAMDKLSYEDHIKAADLLNRQEIKLIAKAYYGDGTYSSNDEIGSFVTEINILIPIFRKAFGTKAKGVV
jgi:hypothetical protein